MIKNGCGQSGGRTLKSTASEERTDGITDSLDFDTDSQKLKADKFFLGEHGQKMGVTSLVMDSKIDWILEKNR